MNSKRCITLGLLFLLTAMGGKTVFAQFSSDFGDDQDAESTGPVSLHRDEADPQIVRISLVQGDVRVAVGKQKGHPEVSPWVQGAANMPLESGFTVVTSKGRVEIEFEDASTLYLGENSALTFEDLSTEDGIPTTDMVLLTGVATLHVRPTTPGEVYTLKTPTDYLRIPYGGHSDVRVNSYVDAMTVTPQSPVEIHLGDVTSAPGLVGKTFTYSNGKLAATPASAVNDFGDWDKWVAARVAGRTRAIHAVLKESGLSEPLPGMADMASRGTFFECKPYGTCWAPTNGWAGAHADLKRVSDSASTPGGGSKPASSVKEQSPPTQSSQISPDAARLAQQAEGDEAQAEWTMAQQQSGGGVASPALWGEDFDEFPCSPYRFGTWMGGPLGGGGLLLADDSLFDSDWYSDDGFDWAVCHAGSWIRWGNRYAWVAGRHRHHYPPVRYVKVGGRVGYVPLHPGDLDGKVPINLKRGIFIPQTRKGEALPRVAYEPGARVKVLSQTPKEFRAPQLPALRTSAAPTLEAHPLRSTSVSSRPAIIAFDARATGFTVSSERRDGGAVHTVIGRYSTGAGAGRGGEVSFHGRGPGAFSAARPAAFGGARPANGGNDFGGVRSSRGNSSSVAPSRSSGAGSPSSSGSGGSHSSGGSSGAPSGGGGGHH